MKNGSRWAWMHFATMLALCVLSWLHADTHVTIAIASGWFGFLTGDKLRSSPVAVVSPSGSGIPYHVDPENSGVLHVDERK